VTSHGHKNFGRRSPMRCSQQPKHDVVPQT
jgi:hypothetical protein